MNNIITLTKKHMSAEMQLLLAWIETSIHSEFDCEYYELLQQVDYSSLAELVEQHDLVPYLYHIMNSMKPKLVSDALFALIEQKYKQFLAAASKRKKEQVRINAGFAKLQIRSVYLQGPVVVKDWQSDIFFQTSSQLVYLVEKEHLLQVNNILMQLGYEQLELPKTASSRQLRSYRLAYFHPQLQQIVIIQWRLSPLPIREYGFEQLWQRRRSGGSEGWFSAALSREDLFIYIMLNGIIHNWTIASMLVDMKKLLHQSINWPLLIELLRKYRLCNAGGATIIFLAQLISIPPHEDIKLIIHSSKANWLAHDMLNQLTLDTTHQSPNSRIQSVLTFRHKCYGLLSFLQPSTEQILNESSPSRIVLFSNIYKLFYRTSSCRQKK
ncbi:nucleotidyltransferase family protein [Paenibacillus sp. GXUN7292]|uniref:nucleotidyltransferase family protein n=1 Tax=Paenibacillus sp. GXUN7292 TaxID=3422499 RepID=UPI003D7DDFFC